MITNTELTPDKADATLQAADAITKRAIDLYELHPRRRFVKLDDEARQALGNLLAGCQTTNNARAFDLFKEALEKLTDEYGRNILRPKQQEKRILPKPFVDPTTNEPVPNPWATGNKKDQRALVKHHPQLAEHLKRLAETPNEYLIELSEAESERLAANEREANYNAAIHDRNVFVSGTKTDIAAFSNACDDPELVKQYHRESLPLTISDDLFKPGDSPGIMGHRQLQTNIIKADDRQLAEVIKAAQQQARTIAVARHQQIELQKRADAIQAARQAQASEELGAGITRLADGRVIIRGA